MTQNNVQIIDQARIELSLLQSNLEQLISDVGNASSEETATEPLARIKKLTDGIRFIGGLAKAHPKTLSIRK